jgi:hypothetical protein
LTTTQFSILNRYRHHKENIVKRHPLDIVSLGSGIVFVAFAIAYLAGVALDAAPSGAVTLPLALAGLGIAGIAALVRTDRESGEAAPGQD